MKKFIFCAVFIILIQNICTLNVSSNYDRNCGVMSESAGLVQGGQLSGKNQFPWITNIFTKQTLAYIFAGSGSLISHHYVLCAANSVAYENYLENGELDPERNYRPLKGIRLILGSTNYKGSNEPDVTVIETVQKVILHPNLKGTKPRIANIALLKIKRPITFSDSVKPVCIWNSNDNQMSNHNNMIMYSVGHGIDESGSISFLRKHAIMTVQSDEICKRFYKKFSSDSGFFCAKGSNGKTACRYDKGLYVKIDGLWYLRGMSSMFKRFQNGTCSPNAPVLYEDIEQYSSWINSIVF
ncbi:CLIP domain-containing serine protease B4-like [Chironomus tepperi]|uniref:CLIP domain-containing serine protease B4-like n=1 Tax=Chironomus tepperi TaxID=113505 RepID=UPI00391FA126